MLSFLLTSIGIVVGCSVLARGKIRDDDPLATIALAVLATWGTIALVGLVLMVALR